MKLWLLEARRDLPEDNDPWDPWYDKAFGFVIRAHFEAEAREEAHQQAGDENRKTKMPWLDPDYSTCVELTTDGTVGTVLRNFATA